MRAKIKEGQHTHELGGGRTMQYNISKKIQYQMKGGLSS